MSLIEVMICIFVVALVIFVVIMALGGSTKVMSDTAKENSIRLKVKNQSEIAEEISKELLVNDGWTINRNGNFFPEIAGENLSLNLVEYKTVSQQFSYILCTDKDIVGNCFVNVPLNNIRGASAGTKVITPLGTSHILTKYGLFSPELPNLPEGTTFILLDANVELIERVGDLQ